MIFRPAIKYLIPGFLFAGLLGCAQQTVARDDTVATYEPLRVTGETPGSGLFDVSIEYGPWSMPVCLFGKLPGCVVDLNRLHPDLARTVFYNEIGTLVHRGTLYVSLDTSTTASGLGDWKNRRIVLVASADSGRTWRYAGTLTNYDDASRLGYLTLTGSSLVTEGGRQFLMVSPAGIKKLFTKNRGHDGTLVSEFEDIDHARLKRDGRGHLQVIKHLPVTLNSGGLSDHDERNTHGGILFSQIDLKAPPEVFRLFSTRQRIAD